MSIGELGMRNVVSLHCDSERVSHRFAQILSLQATVLYTSSLTVKKICVICGKIKHSTLIINKNEKGNNSESNQFRHHRPHCRPQFLLCAELQVIAFEHESNESTECRLNIKQETQAAEPTGLIRLIRIIRVLKK